MAEQALRLTPGQRRYLKQHAHHLKILLQMGKDGPTSAFVKQLLETLQAHELVKLRVLGNCLAEPAEIEGAFAAAQITVVQKVGHIYTVFKQREDESIFDLPL